MFISNLKNGFASCRDVDVVQQFLFSLSSLFSVVVSFSPLAG